MRLRTALRAMSVVLLVWTAWASPTVAAVRNIVLLFDERPELPGLAAIDRDFVHSLSVASPDTLEVYREAMDLSRFGSASHKTRLRDHLREKYRDKKVDLAVGVLGPALDFLLAHGNEIFPGARIIFCGIDRAEFGDRVLPPDVHGVLLKREFDKALALVLQLHPGTERVAVIAGSSEFDTRLLDMARDGFRSYERNLAFDYLVGQPLGDVLARTSRLPPKAIILFLTMFRDDAGQAFVSHDVLERVSAAANAPTYGFVDQYVGRGIVGGYLYSLGEHGTQAGKLAARLLAGDAPAPASVLEPPSSRLLFDWRQMQRWGIAEAALPPGSEIRFRDPTLWSRYRAEILASAAAFALQTMLILWLAYEYRRRHLAEIASRNAMAELTLLNRRASAGALSASIAHEVSQPLAAIASRASAGLRWLRAEVPNLAKAEDALEHVVAASHRASDVVTGVRAMFTKTALEPGPTDLNEIIRTVLSIVRIELRRNHVEVQARLDEQLPAVLGDKVQLQQVVLNLVMNAIEAMQSVQGRVLRVSSARHRPGLVQVSVEDSGPGIDPADRDKVFETLYTTKASGMGMGLSICKSIVGAHHGRISVAPGREGGSVFQIELPVAAAALGGGPAPTQDGRDYAA